MFGYVIDLSGWKARIRDVYDAQYRIWAGVAFLLLAMAAIQYDELVAPRISQVSGAWGAATADFGRKLSSFTL